MEKLDKEIKEYESKLSLICLIWSQGEILLDNIGGSPVHENIGLMLF